MPRMLLLTSSFPRYKGDFAGCFVADFAKALLPDFQIDILVPASISAPQKERMDKINIHRFNYFWPVNSQLLDAATDLQPLIEKSWMAKLQVAPLFLFFLWRGFLLAKEADIICSHWLLPAGLAGSIISKITGKPHIVVEHSGALHLLRKLKVGKFLAKFITACSFRLVMVSDQLRKKMIDLCPESKEKIEVIPMGIDYNDFQVIREREIRKNSELAGKLLFIGRLTEIKGVSILLNALKNKNEILLTVAGDGEDRAALEREAKSLNIKAEFVGVVDKEQKRDLFMEADLVVIPSLILTDGRTEGTPLVCLEAFAAAKTVIASSVGGLAELIIDGETGFLFKPGDSNNLAELITRLLNNREERIRTGLRATEVAARYDWQKIGETYINIFNLALEGILNVNGSNKR